MFGAQKTVLVLSDEAVSVYSPVRGRFAFLGEVKWQDPELVTALADLLSLKGRGRPILILYDMVEQYYRKEIVPKVAFLDQSRVRDRRLGAAFPNYPLRASLRLKADKKRVITVARGESDKSKPMDGVPYLFAALPDHDQIARLTEAVRMSMTVAKDLNLLPIEAVSMVKQLSSLLNQGTAGDDRWIVFMAQHRGGGLRQIVVRNGELALTRLTPIVDTDIEPNIWASEVAQEFSATMGYLSRFGYNANSELEVIVIGNPDATNQLQPQIKSSTFFGLTVRDAARSLRLNIDGRDDLRYGDVLHVAWAARKMQATLPFKIKELAYVSKARVAAKAAATLLTLGAIGLCGYVGHQGWTLMQTHSTIKTSRETLKELTKELNAEIARKEAFNIDVKLVQGSITIYDRLEKNKIDLLQFLHAVADATPPELSFDRVQMGYDVQKKENPDPMAVQTVEQKTFFANLELSFPASMKPEIGNKIVSDLRDSIARALPPMFDVAVTQSVRDLTFRSDFTYRTGSEAQAMPSAPQNLTAIIGIRQKLVTP